MRRISFLLFSYISHAAGYFIGWYSAVLLLSVWAPQGGAVAPRVVALFLLFLLAFGVATLGIALYFKSTAEDSYTPRLDERGRAALLTRLILPAEILRFLASLFHLGDLGNMGIFSVVPSYLYEITYLTWSGRLLAVRQEGAFAFLDFLVYILVYLVYFIVYFKVLQSLHRRYFKMAERLHLAMLTHTREEPVGKEE